jgi:tetratricopeptide (TPR) repeat protein
MPLGLSSFPSPPGGPPTGGPAFGAPSFGSFPPPAFGAPGANPSFGAAPFAPPGPGTNPNLDMGDFAPPGPGTNPNLDMGDFGAPAAKPQDRFGPGEAKPAPQGGSAKCQVCGTELTDEFDKVIGLCEVHQRERSGKEFGPGGAAPEAGAADWRVQKGDGSVLGPFTLGELKSALQQGEASTTDQFARGEGEFGGIDLYPELKGFTKKAEKEAPSRPKSVAATKPTGLRVSLGTVLMILVLISLVLGGGYVMMNPNVAEGMLGKLSSKGTRMSLLPPNPLKRMLDQWKLAHPDVSGTPDEHLVTARARHLEDTWRGYQLAQDSLQRALLLDEDNPRAVSGYVENLAIWKGPLLTEDELRLAEAAIRYALAAAPEDSAIQRGRAALSLVRGDLNGTRAAAEAALAADASDAQARLLLAGSFIEGNVTLAIREAELAAGRLPELRRSDRVLARGYANAGRYAAAIKVLEKRLQSDANNGAILWLLGDINRELADSEAAKKFYQRALEAEGDTAGVRLALAELMLELRDFRAAGEAYRPIVEGGKAPAAYKITALAGLARSELDSGRAPRAKEYAKAAVELQPREPVSLLVLAEIALEEGQPQEALALAKRAIEAREGEPAALIVLARSSIALRKSDEAVRYAEEAVQNDPRDPRLRGILGGMYIAAGGNDRAFTVMKQAGDLDPLERDSRHRKNLLALSDRAQREAIERYREAAKELRDRSVANSSAAMLHYHLGEPGRAKELIDLSLEADDNNPAALVYKAQLALDRGAAKEAEETARRLLRSDRGSAIGQLMLGRSLAALSRNREASEAFDAALRSSRGMLVAEVERAGIQLLEGQRDQAIETLSHAHRVNPHLLRTRKLLLQAGY